MFDPFINAAQNRFQLPPGLLQAAIGIESSGNPRAVSKAGAMGLLQLMPGTYDDQARKHGLGADAFDPENNIMAGAGYWRQALDATGGDLAKSAAYYNAGPGGAASFIRTGDFSTLPAETQGYLRKLAAAGLLRPEQAPPVDVAARKPAAQVPGLLTRPVGPQSEAQSAPVNVPAGQVPGLLTRDLSKPVDTTGAQPSLMSDPDNQAMMLLALGSGLLSGRNWAEGLAGAGQGVLQAMAAARQGQSQKALRDMQVLEYQQKQAQRQAQMQSANAYAAQLEKAGKGDLATAIRGNPALMDEIVKEQAKTAFGGGGGPFQGTGMEQQANNLMLTLGPKVADGTATQQERMAYEQAYLHLSSPRVIGDPVNGFSTVTPQMPGWAPRPGSGATAPVGSGAAPQSAGQPPQPAPQQPASAAPPSGGPTITPIQPGTGQSANDRSKLKQAEVDAQSIRSALGDFRTAVQGAGTMDNLAAVFGINTPGASKLNSTYNNAALMSKAEGLYNLGVLNGPDLDIIRRTMTDPSTIRSLGTSREAWEQQISAIEKLIDDRLAAYRQQYGTAGSTPATPTTQQPSAQPATQPARVMRFDAQGNPIP